CNDRLVPRLTLHRQRPNASMEPMLIGNCNDACGLIVLGARDSRVPTPIVLLNQGRCSLPRSKCPTVRHARTIAITVPTILGAWVLFSSKHAEQNAQRKCLECIAFQVGPNVPVSDRYRPGLVAHSASDELRWRPKYVEPYT